MAHIKIVTLPIRFEFRPVLATWSLRDGKLHSDDGSEGSSIWKGKQSKKPLDAWEMRSELFRLLKRGELGGDTDALLTFLNRWGVWKSFLDPSTSWDDAYRTTYSPEEIWQRGELFRNALLDAENHPRWLMDPGTNIVTTLTSSEWPHQICEVRSCEYAMRMTVTIDLLKKAKYRECKRWDCAGIFVKGSDPRKRFCSQYCGHLVAVRAKRSKERKSTNGRSN